LQQFWLALDRTFDFFGNMLRGFVIEPLLGRFVNVFDILQIALEKDDHESRQQKDGEQRNDQHRRIG